MNRAERRREAGTAKARRALPRVPQADSIPSSEVCDGVCRSCSRQRQLYLPARICGRCIEGAMEKAKAEQAAAMLQAMIDEFGDDVDE